MNGAQIHRRAVKRYEVADRRAQVMRLWARGLTQREIAAKLGVSKALVTKDCAAVLDETKADAAKGAEAYRAKELVKLAEEERELWAAWERSKRDRKKIRRESTSVMVATTGEAGEVPGELKELPGEKRAYEREGRLPEPQYMARIAAIHERRAKLLGLDAPEEKRITGPNGGPLQTQDVASLTAEEAARLYHDTVRGDGNG